MLRRVIIQWVVIGCLVSLKTTAQTAADSAFLGALRYLEATQVDSTVAGVQYAGEWPIWMNLQQPYIFMGKPIKAHDSNCFNVAAVHNFLAEIYAADSSLHLVKPLLEASFKEILTYRTPDGRFNFWKLLPPTRRLKLIGKEPNQLVRRPTQFPLRNRFIHKIANIGEDADDTALGNLAILWQHRLFGFDSVKLAPAERFDEYKDLNRKNKHWYNYLLPMRKNSGAFLTWHLPEFEYTVWTPAHAYFSMVFMFVPFSGAYPHAYEPHMVFGANDVDAVVNANVLGYLAQSKQLNRSVAAKDAARFLDFVTRKQHWHTAGNYYPNSYSIDFALARAYRHGAKDLTAAAERSVKHLLATQQPDGHFESKYFVNDKDIIQSTAYALHALIDYRATGQTIPPEAIQRATQFLLQQARWQGTRCSWEGGVYFSAGTILRNILIWQSDAYTTALIARCLQQVR